MGPDYPPPPPTSAQKKEPFAKLGYTQALILLGLPAEERAEFITQLLMGI